MACRARCVAKSGFQSLGKQRGESVRKQRKVRRKVEGKVRYSAKMSINASLGAEGDLDIYKEQKRK